MCLSLNLPWEKKEVLPRKHAMKEAYSGIAYQVLGILHPHLLPLMRCCEELDSAAQHLMLPLVLVYSWAGKDEGCPQEHPAGQLTTLSVEE